MTRNQILAVGAVVTIAVGVLVAGPLGGNRQVATRIEQYARAQLDYDEMTAVRAQVQDGPLRRRLFLTGPADDFQRTEIVRRTEWLPGVAEARWNRRSALFPLPMMIEAILMALAAFAAGTILSYLSERRRRARALDRY